MTEFIQSACPCPESQGRLFKFLRGFRELQLIEKFRKSLIDNSDQEITFEPQASTTLNIGAETLCPKALRAVLIDQLTGELYYLPQTGLAFVGRGESNEIVLKSSKTVSRLHAFIQERDGKLLLSDLASCNGTYVNGKQLERFQSIELKQGDRIRLGLTGLCVVFSPRFAAPCNTEYGSMHHQ